MTIDENGNVRATLDQIRGILGGDCEVECTVLAGILPSSVLVLSVQDGVRLEKFLRNYKAVKDITKVTK